MWDVIINGRHSGFVESNYAYASEYWAERARVTGKRIRLVERRNG